MLHNAGRLIDPQFRPCSIGNNHICAMNSSYTAIRRISFAAKRRLIIVSRTPNAQRLCMTDAGRHRGDGAKGRLIRSLALVVGALIVVLGVAGVVIPDIVIATGRHFVSTSGLYAAAAFRVGVGLVLILAARESRAPGILRAIGAVVIVGGVAAPFFGVEAAWARLDWEAAHSTFFRVEGAAFVCLGVLIVSALRSGRPITTSAIADVNRR